MLMQKLDGGKSSSRSPHSCRPPIAHDVHDALEAVIATEAGNGQLQSAVWQTLRNITGQTLSSRTLPGRFLFEEVELLQVLMERLGPGSAFVEQCGSCRAYAQPPGHQTTW